MNNEPGEAEQANAADQEENQRRMVRDTTEGNEYSEAPGKSNQKCCQKETMAKGVWWKRSPGPVWVTAIATAMIFLTNMAYVYYAKKQWGVMSGQLDQLARQYPVLEKSADAAKISAGAALDALHQMRTNLETSERPYVLAGDIRSPYIAIGHRIKADVIWADYGRTPGLRVTTFGRIFFGPNALHQADRWFARIHTTPPVGSPEFTIIAPGVPTDLSKQSGLTYSTLTSHVPISQKEFEFVVNNNFSVVFVVGVNYFDLAGNRYWTDQCWSRLTTGAMPQCADHNEVH